MSECPRCEFDLDDVLPGDNQCPNCGLLYIGVQIGETWSDDEYQLAVWETDPQLTKEHFGVTDRMFENHQLKPKSTERKP